jgi:phage baseplate assembly protein W
MESVNVKTVQDVDQETDQQDATKPLDPLPARADGLADVAAQSLKQVLETQTGRRVSSLTASTLRRIVQNIIDAAVATHRLEDKKS